MGDGGVSGWQGTRLWTVLEDRSDDVSQSVKAVAARILPKVQKVLDHGDTMPGNFTLHDSDHSRRVAERMADIAGNLLPELSSYDLGLLLHAAYLHDIGMTPELKRVSSHFTYLLGGDDASLSIEERKALQVFLDDHWDGLVPPIAAGVPTAAAIARTSEVVTAYVRDRHNDWGAEWIRENLADLDEELYAGWIEDLVLLCRSHHFGLEQLIQHNFDPRLIGTTGAVRHLRYCACLLRVADVLDFDPERTPAILFRHRDVGDQSAIFWHKDHALGFDLEDGQITIQAQPPNAIIHNAIIRTVEDVERELLLCDRLATEKPFSFMPGPKELPYRWTLNSHIHSFIEPRNERYEYVDGTFRPDPKRVLDLIGGVELYGSELVAVRELLQNAFDAVREQIARERLTHPAPGEEKTREELARTHRVTLSLERNGEEVRIVCRDTGSGMSKDLLLSRFLVGGRSANHEMRDLERQCKALGFTVGRTARFGIGVLSYFLLGRRLQVDTRRSIEAGDREGVGWTFSSEGLDDFGELSKNLVCGRGTAITLVLKDEAVGEDYEKFAENLREYVDDTVRRVPCHFSFEAGDSRVDAITTEPGWLDRETEKRAAALRGLRSRTRPSLPTELLARREQEQHAAAEAGWQEIRKRAGQALFFWQELGELPEDLGTYRMALSRFRLGEHDSLAYLDLSEEQPGTVQLQLIGGSESYVPPSRFLASWNGMQVSDDAVRRQLLPRGLVERVPALFLELDWTSDAAGRLAVDRNSIQLSESAVAAMKGVIERAADVLQEIIDETAASPFCFLSAQLLSLEPPPDSRLFWVRGDTIAPHLEELRGLLRNAHPFVRDDVSGDCSWEGETVWSVRAISALGGGSGPGASRQAVWHGEWFRPLKLALVQGSLGPRPSGIWSLDRLPRAASKPLDHACPFPPRWDEVVGVWSFDGILWNSEHPLVEQVDESAWDWADDREDAQDPLKLEDEILESPARAAAWVLRGAMSYRRELWHGLADRDSDFLPAVWRHAGLADDETVKIVLSLSGLEVRTVSCDALEEETGSDVFRWIDETTRDLAPEWWLTELHPGPTS